MAAISKDHPIPLLIISDSVTAPTGLARIACKLATYIHRSLGDMYRVGTLGFGGLFDPSLGFPQWTAERVDDFVLPQLPEVWHRFAGDEQGIVLCIWDPCRLPWVAVPESAETLIGNPALRKWLAKPPFEKWLYCPIDGAGYEGRLTFSIMKTLFGFDRILAYSEWGKSVIEATISPEEAKARHLDALPHGIDTSVFCPTPDRSLARSVLPQITNAASVIAKPRGVKDNEFLVGIVATNQSRKNWALGIETVAALAQHNKVRLWIHTDALQRHFDILGTLIDCGLLGEQTLVSTGDLTDTAMADAYSACDVTLGIGPEGFGYPIFESLACGTPCIHGNYGGAPEHLPPEYLVEPIGFYRDGLQGTSRPVYRASDFADKVMKVAGTRATLPSHLDWINLWPRWEKWFRDATVEAE